MQLLRNTNPYKQPAHASQGFHFPHQQGLSIHCRSTVLTSSTSTPKVHSPASPSSPCEKAVHRYHGLSPILRSQLTFDQSMEAQSDLTMPPLVSACTQSAGAQLRLSACNANVLCTVLDSFITSQLLIQLQAGTSTQQQGLQQLASPELGVLAVRVLGAVTDHLQ